MDEFEFTLIISISQGILLLVTNILYEVYSAHHTKSYFYAGRDHDLR